MRSAGVSANAAHPAFHHTRVIFEVYASFLGFSTLNGCFKVDFSWLSGRRGDI